MFWIYYADRLAPPSFHGVVFVVNVNQDNIGAILHLRSHFDTQPIIRCDQGWLKLCGLRMRWHF